MFENGYALFLEKRYVQALSELQRAEDAFRKLDARGHPFTIPLSNGVSGLANALALSGQCWQFLGNYEKAVLLYETSLINAKFEKKDTLSGVHENAPAKYAVLLSEKT